MSKKIHTIQSSDKNEFDKKVNNLLGIGCELLENTYEVIKNNDGVIYSQVIEFDTINTYITFYNDGQLDLMGMLDKDGKRVGLWTKWYENGNKKEEGLVIDENTIGGIVEDGLWTYWYENGNKKEEGTYGNYGRRVGKWTFYNEDGSVKEVKEY